MSNGKNVEKKRLKISKRKNLERENIEQENIERLKYRQVIMSNEENIEN